MRKLIASYGAAEAVAKGLNIALTLGLAAFVDIHSYGIIVILIAIEQVLIEVIVLGQHTAILRFYESYRNALSTLYAASLRLVLFATGVALLLYILLPLREWKVVSENIHDLDLLLLIISTALQCHLALYLAYLRSVEQVWEYGCFRVGYQVTKLFSVLAAVLLLGDASAYPVGVLIASILVFLLLTNRVNRRTRGYQDLGKFPRESYNVLKQNALIGIPLAVNAVASVLYTVMDRFFLERMIDQKHVAIYNFAFVQGTSIFFVVSVVALAYVPRIYRSQSYNGESIKALSDFLRVSVLGTFGLAPVVYFVVYPVSLHFVATEYQEGRLVLALALVSVLLQPLIAYGLYKLTLLRKVVVVPVVTLCALLFNVLFNSALIPHYGMEGAAAAVVFSQALYGMLLMAVAHAVAKRVST